MPFAHDTDETVAKQQACAHFRAGRFTDDTGFQIDGAVAQQGAVLVQFLHEVQTHTGRFFVYAGDQ
ncbi:hypothetical protein D3C86_1960420 [compost metagenome]